MCVCSLTCSVFLEIVPGALLGTTERDLAAHIEHGVIHVGSGSSCHLMVVVSGSGIAPQRLVIRYSGCRSARCFCIGLALGRVQTPAVLCRTRVCQVFRRIWSQHCAQGDLLRTLADARLVHTLGLDSTQLVGNIGAGRRCRYFLSSGSPILLFVGTCILQVRMGKRRDIRCGHDDPTMGLPRGRRCRAR